MGLPKISHPSRIFKGARRKSDVSALSRPQDITIPQFNQTKRHILDLLRSARARQPLETMDHP
jgi:hypothetical protein